MLRSLAAIIIAAIAGLAAAKTIEGGGAALAGVEPSSALYGILLVAGWFAGAFIAALLALMIGKRWAPLGMLAAASILLAAMITLLSNPLSWVLWPGAVIAATLGGYAAVRIVGGKTQHPDLKRKYGLFDE